MGAILSEQAKEPKTERLNSFKKSQASNLQAEVFLEELQYVLDEDLLENLVMRPQGMNPRVKGADILSLSRAMSMALGKR